MSKEPWLPILRFSCFSMILASDFSLPHLSAECKHVLSRMLVTNPSQRATLPEILAHPWLTKGYDGAPDAYLPRRTALRAGELDPEVIKGMTGFEFGTPEDIESRMTEVLTSDAYRQALSLWENANGGSSSLAGSTPIGSSVSKETTNSAGAALDTPDLARSNTSARNSPEVKAKTASKRFSGIDFYRKKIQGNSLFGGGNGKEADASNGTNGASNGTGVNGAGATSTTWPGAGKEPLDPTRGFHPLISIYYLVQEKMDREKLYGHSFFASSNVSLQNAKGAVVGTAATGGRPTAAAMASSSMPTAADIPQEALRVPEVSHPSSRPAPLSVPGPTQQRALPNPASPTPIFESRDKSKPLPNMTGAPRSRANDEEMGVALRDKGFGSPTMPHPNSAGPTASWPQSPSMAAPAAPPKSPNLVNVANNHKRSVSLSGRRPTSAAGPDSTPAERSQRSGATQENRRSMHVTMTPPANFNRDSMAESSAEPSSSPSSAFGANIASNVKRWGSFISRSPSTPLDAESREKRRQARMSTGGMPGTSRRGSTQMSTSMAAAGAGALSGVDEKGDDEREHLQSESPLARSEDGHGQRRSSNIQESSRMSSSVGRAAGNAASPSRQTTAIPPEQSSISPPPVEKGAWHGGNSNQVFKAGALSPKKGKEGSSKPVFLKGLFSVQTTSTKPRAVIHADLVRVLDRIGVQYREISGGYECVHLPSIDFSGNEAAAQAGQGNARIPVEGGGIENVASPEQGQRNVARRKPSRISFASSKNKSVKKDGSTSNAADSASSIHDLPSRSRASSMTTGTMNDAAESSGRPVTPSSRLTRQRTDSLARGAPASPVLSTSAGTGGELPPISSGASASPSNPFSTNTVSNFNNSNSKRMDSVAASELAVRFEVYVVKVPLLLGVNGLQFRRVGGNAWQYSMLAKRVLQELKVSCRSQIAFQHRSRPPFPLHLD